MITDKGYDVLSRVAVKVLQLFPSMENMTAALEHAVIAEEIGYLVRMSLRNKPGVPRNQFAKRDLVGQRGIVVGAGQAGSPIFTGAFR